MLYGYVNKIECAVGIWSKQCFKLLSSGFKLHVTVYLKSICNIKESHGCIKESLNITIMLYKTKQKEKKKARTVIQITKASYHVH